MTGERITAGFSIISWEEQTFHEDPAAEKLNQTRAAFRYEGDIEGESTIAMLMAYQTGGTADYVGMERISGMLLGRSGSFVLRHVGHFDGTTSRADVSVVADSAAGELVGLSGGGRAEASHGGGFKLELTVALPGE